MSSFDSCAAAVFKDSSSLTASSALQKTETISSYCLLFLFLLTPWQKYSTLILIANRVKRAFDTISYCRLSRSQALALGLKRRDFGLDYAQLKPGLSPEHLPKIGYFLPTQSKTLPGNVHILYLTYSYGICWTKSEY